MELNELQVFQAVAAERSFSRAAAKLHRTQPAVSQAIRRLEDELGERLFDRSSKGGRLTETGTVLLDYAERMSRLRNEAVGAVRELQELAARPGRRRRQRGRRPRAAADRRAVPAGPPPHAQVEMRRVHSRQIPGEVLDRSLDFGLVTYPPGERGLRSVRLGVDELVMLTHPGHPLARRRTITMSEFGRQTVIAHNDPSPRRDLVLRLFEEQHAVDQHPAFAAEPGRHQAGGRDGPGGGAIAPALRALRDRPGTTRGGSGAGAARAPRPAARLPPRRGVVARGRGLPRGGPGARGRPKEARDGRAAAVPQATVTGKGPCAAERRGPNRLPTAAGQKPRT